MREIILVLGGSGSGKSEFAEALLQETWTDKYYIATMRAFGGGDLEKIEKHKKSREGKGFTTLEWDKFFPVETLGQGGAVLIECMGTFCANWYFDGGDCLAELQAELSKVFGWAEKTVVVSNDVFYDGMEYTPETMAYMSALGTLNRWIAARADRVVEVVFGIPLNHKGGSL